MLIIAGSGIETREGKRYRRPTMRVNGLAEFKAAIEGLDRASLLALSVRADAAEGRRLEAARAQAHQAAGRLGLEEKLDRMRDDIVHWSTAWGAGAGLYAPDMNSADVALEDMRRGAAQAIFDAATALTLGEALDAETQSVLWYRWESAVG
jgi:hypothetical protein